MAHNFRSAFNGFHREDVVRYLEYLNNKHQNQVNQLNTELEELRARTVPAAPDAGCSALEEENRQLRMQMEALEARCAELTAQLEAVPQKDADRDARELDAYRQAARIQKEAKDRTELLYFQADHVLTEANTRLDRASADMTELTDQVMRQITQLQVAVSAGKQSLQEAAAILATIRPNR